ncbi:transposase [Pseudomonas syringae]|uniref:ISPs1, transposase OrfB n=1 Tax=Pseudomonas syringae pv. aceris TaxID=199198 RepID=A0A0P9I823_PSESX|nr:ISPs1, transposase OrfB [Pseudomonas syringae pv. aceris str. M302273]KPW21192.1 ISPs1, transposase OrfB [Pseudomonas syringae pv. aceris]KPY52225.1 ISPs1, transposase OrfB [Pseudomonas syringae pv. solidagae]MCF5274129.1 transposase [Pseudomonas syringae]MCF5280231.1 transposase [Pseudomonas syringae]
MLLQAVAGSDQPSWQQGAPTQALPLCACRQGLLHRKPRPGLPRLFDGPQYKKRNVMERLFSWLKEKRRICRRYDKLASSFKAMVTLACIERCLWADFSDKP